MCVTDKCLQIKIKRIAETVEIALGSVNTLLETYHCTVAAMFYDKS